MEVTSILPANHDTISIWTLRGQLPSSLIKMKALVEIKNQTKDYESLIKPRA